MCMKFLIYEKKRYTLYGWIYGTAAAILLQQ